MFTSLAGVMRLRQAAKSPNKFIPRPECVHECAKNWWKTIPHIYPFYAMKSNPHPWVVKLLVRNGIGLDVASHSELSFALKNTDKIIYTNPYSRQQDLDLLKANPEITKVVDSDCELKRIHVNGLRNPLLIRIKTDDQNAACRFSVKFGRTKEEAFDLARRAMDLGFSIKGISFHIGSGGTYDRRGAYLKAIADSKELLDQIGGGGKVIDIGGGLVPSTDLKDALGWTENLSKEYELWAEPGRYFSEQSHDLVTEVIGIRPGNAHVDIGVYHELNVMHRDHWEWPRITHYLEGGEIHEVESREPTQLWGPTCDGLDNLGMEEMPELLPGDKIFLPAMGAYTVGTAVAFNGVPAAQMTMPTTEDVGYERFVGADQVPKDSAPLEPIFEDSAMSLPTYQALQ